MTGVPQCPGPCPSCHGALSVSWLEATRHQLPEASNGEGPACLRLPPTLQTHYEQYHGFVILHGTDTMAFAASVLAFALENLQKTVILTGSQVMSQAVGAEACGSGRGSGLPEATGSVGAAGPSSACSPRCRSCSAWPVI